MRSMVRWEPFSDLISLRDAMNRLFEDSFVRPSRTGGLATWGGGMVPMDMLEHDDQVVVKASVPGVQPEEIDITITGDTLTIKGETYTTDESESDRYLCRECRYGAFSRSMTLPSGLDTDGAEASFENGVLTLRIPKAEKAKPKMIKVKKAK